MRRGVTTVRMPVGDIVIILSDTGSGAHIDRDASVCLRLQWVGRDIVLFVSHAAAGRLPPPQART